MSTEKKGKARPRRPDERDDEGRRVRRADDSDTRPARKRRPDEGMRPDRKASSA